MLKVIENNNNLTRKKLADKNLGMTYHERLDKSKYTESKELFFQVDCENGYSRFNSLNRNKY